MSTTTTLWWPGRLLAEDDLRRHWASHGEIVLGTKTIVTPLASEFLKDKRIAIRREDPKSAGPVSQKSVWGFAEETPSPLVAAAVKALDQPLAVLERNKGDVIAWLRAIAKQVAAGNPPGAVIVSEHAALAAYIANKVNGVRAAAVCQPLDVGPLKKILGPNVFAIAAKGRTYFELRQLLKLTTMTPPQRPEGLDDANR